MKLTLTDPDKPEIPIKLSLIEEDGGDIRLEAKLNSITTELLRITTEGEIIRIVGQKDKLLHMGFKVVKKNGRSQEVVYVD